MIIFWHVSFAKVDDLQHQQYCQSFLSLPGIINCASYEPRHISLMDNSVKFNLKHQHFIKKYREVC